MEIQLCPNCQAEIKAGTQICPHCGYAFPFATDMLDAGRVLQKRYELVKLIHSGGMGYIYLAQDRRLDREVVVKQVRQPVKSDAHRKKLEEEALRMAQLSHPAVAMVFDHFVEADFYFLVVEYIKGQTLSEIFEKSGRSLEESQVINWMVQVCEVIGYLHNKGMVHRDISPDNIMLTDEGHIKLIDFGTLHDLSMLAGKKAGKEGKFGFTPKEQWDGNPIPQSDVFAIGATAYYLLTGYLQVSQACLRGENARPEDFNPVYPPITEERRDISDGLGMVLSKTLSPEYINRYGGATELGAALKVLTFGVERAVPKAAMAGELNLDTRQIDFGQVQPGSVLSRKFRIANPEGKLLMGSAESTQPWLKIWPPVFDGWGDVEFVASASGSDVPSPRASASATIILKTGQFEDRVAVTVNDVFRESVASVSQKVRPKWLLPVVLGSIVLLVLIGVVIADSIFTKVIFEDDFSNANNGWNTGPSPDYEIGYKQGSLGIKVNKFNTVIVACNNKLAYIDDFIVEINVKGLTGQASSIDSTGFYVISFRRSDENSEYSYKVRATGSYTIEKWVKGQYTSLKAWTGLPAISTVIPVNRLKVACQGSNLKFYINDILMTTLTDYSLKTGKIGIGVGVGVGLAPATPPTYLSFEEALFDNFKVSVP